jgi:uncharacterized membrane protein
MHFKPVQNLLDYDHRRASLPGEHLITLAAGVVLLLVAREARTVGGAVAALAAGSALIYRAASGTDGAMRLLRR